MPISPAELDEVLTRLHDGERAADLESEALDFKRQPDSKDDAIKRLVDAVICFANSTGGTLVMGMPTRRPAQTRSLAVTSTQRSSNVGCSTS